MVAVWSPGIYWNNWHCEASKVHRLLGSLRMSQLTGTQSCKEKTKTQIRITLADAGSKLPESDQVVNFPYIFKNSKTLGKDFHVTIITTAL